MPLVVGTMAITDDDLNIKARGLISQLQDGKGHSSDEHISQILSEFRILTREKTLTREVLDSNCIELLVYYSIKSHIEAQKCLSNLILNYPEHRDCLVKPYVNCVKDRLGGILSKDFVHNEDERPEQRQTHYQVIYYDLRIIFLLSALCPESRAEISENLVELIWRMVAIESEHISDENQLILVESLKTLFNLTMKVVSNGSLAASVIKRLFSLTRSINIESKTQDLGDEILVNLIHLLTNMPEEVYSQLSQEDVDLVLTHLDEQLKGKPTPSARESMLPVLNCCANICNYKEDVRSRWFETIIGSNTDFEKRPEEYDDLRGRLVKLMTSVDVHVKDIAASFLHSLCGGDTEKLITYAGFGNAAAFLSSRGLLSAGGDASSQGGSGSSKSYSYQELRDRLDPITGKLSTPKTNPMEGMSEEEKEWHAQELASAITRLSNLGVVKPMRMDSDMNLTDLNPEEELEKESSRIASEDKNKRDHDDDKS